MLLEVTARCDLACPVCFAASGGGQAPPDPSLEEIEGWYGRLLTSAPDCNVQLSGGEPSVRDDLPQVVALGRRMGLRFFQLNSNGLRLAADDGYADALAAAGLNTVFLQFDGVTESPYVALRGKELLEAKMAAIDACGHAGLGVVLVPTVVAGVNLHQLGDLLSFALQRSPTVRGIHLQPLALLGRYPDHEWSGPSEPTTLPDVMRELVRQSGGRVRLEDFTPGDCEHPLCSFSREYLRGPDGTLVPLERPSTTGCCPSGDGASLGAADKAARVAARWSLPSGSGAVAKPRSGAADSGCCSGGASSGAERGNRRPAAEDDFDELLRDLRCRSFTISAMAFQDAWTIDLERLQQCYLHVLARDGRLVPFCAYNLTGVDGRGLPHGRAASVPVATSQGFE